MDATYTVVINNGQIDDLVEANLTQDAAIAIAKKTAAEFQSVFVTFRRTSDGQTGYLNQDGNHDISGAEWTSETSIS